MVYESLEAAKELEKEGINISKREMEILELLLENKKRTKLINEKICVYDTFHY